MMPYRRILPDVDKCTGCNMCTLACSASQTGAYNPRHAKIKIGQDLIGLVQNIEFVEHCDVKLFDRCNLNGSKPACTEYCIFGALTFKTG